MALTLGFLLSESTVLAGVGPMSASVASEYVNQAIGEIAVRLPLAERETLAISSCSSGENKLYLPADCDEVITLSYATGATTEGGYVIRQAAAWEADKQSEGTGTGTPFLYQRFSSWLELYPSPNSAYSLQLRYLKRFSDLTNTNLPPSVGTQYHQAVLLKTAARLAERGGNYQRAGYLENRYLAFMSSVPDSLAQRQRDRTGMGLRLLTEED